jgi:hypothetical protein
MRAHEVTISDLQTAARIPGRRLQLLNARTEAELDAVFTVLADLKTGGQVIANETFFASRAHTASSLAAASVARIRLGRRPAELQRQGVSAGLNRLLLKP